MPPTDFPIGKKIKFRHESADNVLVGSVSGAVIDMAEAPHPEEYLMIPVYVSELDKHYAVDSRNVVTEIDYSNYPPGHAPGTPM